MIATPTLSTIHSRGPRPPGCPAAASLARRSPAGVILPHDRDGAEPRRKRPEQRPHRRSPETAPATAPPCECWWREVARRSRCEDGAGRRGHRCDRHVSTRARRRTSTAPVRLKGHCRADQPYAEGRPRDAPERAGRDELVEADQAKRHREHDGRGEPRLRGLRTRLGLEPRLVLERRGDVSQKCREVPTRAPLEADRGDEEVDPARGRALAERGERRVRGRPELEVGPDARELAPDRPFELCGGECDRRAGRMPARERVGDPGRGDGRALPSLRV